MTLLPTTLRRAEHLAIESGSIVLKPRSGNQYAANQWLKVNHDQLLAEILLATGHTAYLYDRYSTGCYGTRKTGGVALQFVELISGEGAFTVFNAEVRRVRTTKHGKNGSMLPDGQFSTGKRSAFVSFWLRIGLPLPRRLSAFHDCMGKLKRLVYTGQIDSNGRLNKATLKLLVVPDTEIRAAVTTVKAPDNSLTISRQLPDNSQTRTPDKQSSQDQTVRAIQPDLTTGDSNYVQRLTGSRVTDSHSTPMDQPTDEWLSDYANG